MDNFFLLARRHWIATAIAVCAILWGFGMNLAFAKGLLYFIPNGVIFLFLVAPVLILATLGISHPETRKRYHLIRTHRWKSAGLFVLTCVVLIAIIWLLYFITILNPQTKPASDAALPSIETNNLPLIYSKIDTFSIYSCNWSAGTNRGYCLGGRTGNVASASDLTVNFDITNPNSMDVRISEIKIKVERFDNISVRIEPLAGMQTKRNYVCQLSTNTDFYKCEWLNGKPDQYIKLAKNELEHFCINTQTQTAGFYQVSFWVQYVIGSETKTEKAGVANLYFGNF